MFKKIIKLSIILICMFTIFKFSSDNDIESNKKSDGVIINTCKVFFGRNLSKQETKKYIKKYVVFVRKTAHFLIYLILGLSIISFVKEYRPVDTKAIIIALVISMLYSVSDEIHQIFVSGRSCEIRDIIIDSLGSLTGIYLYYLINNIRSKKV